MSLFAGSLTTGKLFNSSLFNGGLFDTAFPGSLFSGGYVGAWLDINDLSLLYTTDTGSTHVTAVSDAIGRAVTKSGGTVNALQATASLRPILGQWPSGGRYYAYHDRVDDALTLAGMPAGTYTIGTASFAGVQIYNNYYSAGTLTIPGVDFSELVIINRQLTGNENTALAVYLGTKTPTIGATDIFRIYCSSSSVNLSVSETASSGATWELGDGQTATGTSCVKTITPPQSIILRATNPANITGISFFTKSLYGQIDLSKLINLASPNIASNEFTGALLLITNANLVSPSFYLNKLCGTLDLSNQTSLASINARDNLFTGFSGSVAPSLGNIILQNNMFTTSAVNNLLAAVVATGRTIANGTCTITIHGTGNAAPSGQGITDKATLTSRGWTVVTN